MEYSQDNLAKRASLTAGIIGAVMVMFVCFGAALVFSNPAGANTGGQLQEVAAQNNDRDGSN